MSRLKFLIESL